MYSKREDYDNEVVRRLLAYWLATYGVVRMSAGLYDNRIMTMCAAATYLIEGSACMHEAFIGSMIIQKAFFVSFSSFVIAWCLVVCY